MARLRPSLEGLTERIVPAVSVKFIGGSLTITANPANVSNNLVVTQQAIDGKFVIADGPVSVGPYRVTGNITITSSNANDTIQVNLNRGAAGNFQLPGFLNINSRNGADTVTINSDGTNGGRIGGNLILSTGFSNDTVNIGTAGGSISIGGAISANLDSGLDTFNLGTTGTAANTFVVGRGVTLLRANTVNMGTGTDPVTVNGTVSIDNTLDYGITNRIRFGITGDVLQARAAGNFCYNGGTLIDNIGLYGTIQGAPGKNSVINMGQGTNTLDINAEIGFGTASDLIVTGGAGVDDIAFNDDTKISNDAIFSLGGGDNLYGLNSTFSVDGDMSITAGNGTDAVGIFAGQIGGNLTLSLGNGSNSLTFAGATTGAAQSASCHDFTYNGGDGVDDITYDANNGAVENSLTVNLGSGSDTFDGTNSGDSSYLTGFIDLGLDLDPDQVTYRSALAAVTEIVNIFPNDTVTAV